MGSAPTAQLEHADCVTLKDGGATAAVLLDGRRRGDCTACRLSCALLVTLGWTCENSTAYAPERGLRHRGSALPEAHSFSSPILILGVGRGISPEPKRLSLEPQPCDLTAA